jgi:hypothetical protein
MSNATPEELATAAREKGVFSFLDRLKGRNYAKDSVVIHLDEEKGYELTKLVEELKAEGTTPEQQDALLAQIDAKRAELAPDAYTFYLEGFSSERYDELIDDAKEQYPYEYEEIVDPWSGRKSKEPIPDEKRNEYFTQLLWAESIKRVESIDGVDDNITPEFIATFRKQAPLDAIRRISVTIDKLRMASEWTEYAEDEDFTLKP